MARNTNKGKGVGGIQKISMRKRKEEIMRKKANRKRDYLNKSS
jgi:hypothetical protein